METDTTTQGSQEPKVIEPEQSRVQPNQLIDENRTFIRESIDKVSAHLLGQKVDKEYFSVAIIGVQNSGKSTLLNHLFGTNFDVLHQIAGTRTTRGILVSLDKTENIVVMDVEGNDAMDRSEEQDYEKMVATFALVAADVLIINIWSKSLGQYTGSQYETLNIILDICISQFRQESPKTILFCVRDFNQEFDDEGEIRRKIIKDVNNIWIKAEKPPEYEKYETMPEKFFNVEVSVLKKYKESRPQYFLEGVEQLRKKFTDKESEDYIFKKKKTQFNLPISDFSQLLENSWASILTNKKLNLPGEKEQLANFRCSDILNQVSDSFQQQMSKIILNKTPCNLTEVFNRYKKSFQDQTYMYAKQVVSQKYETLEQEMNESITKASLDILLSEEARIKEKFRTQVGEVNRLNSLVLEQKINSLKIEAIEKYSDVFKKIDYEIKDRKQMIEKLTQTLEADCKATKTRVISAIESDFQKEYSRSMRLLSSQVLKEYFGLSFWKKVAIAFAEKKAELLKDYEVKINWARDRSLTPEETDAIDEKLSTELRDNIRSELEKSLVNRVFEFFIRNFTKSPEGTAYNFNILQEEKIRQIYDKSRDDARAIMSVINQYNVQRSRQSSIIEFQEEEQMTFFEGTWLSNAENELDRKMMNEYETVIRRKKEDQMKRVPIWLFVFIAYFVYDDVWFSAEEYPIMNFIFTLLLVFVAFFFAIGQQDAFLEIWNLILQTGNGLVGEVRKKIGH